MSRLGDPVNPPPEPASGDSDGDCCNYVRNALSGSRADLALLRVVEAWPDLPKAVQAGILALVEAASKGEGQRG